MLKIRQCRKIRAQKRFNLDFTRKIKMNSKEGFFTHKVKYAVTDLLVLHIEGKSFASI